MGSVLVFFVNLLTTVVGYFGFQIATKTAFYLLAVTATVSMSVALASLSTALITGIAASLSHPWLLNGVGLFLPWNASLCVAAYISAAFAKWMFRLGMIHVMIAAR